jgi:hypothetical protein
MNQSMPQIITLFYPQTNNPTIPPRSPAGNTSRPGPAPAIPGVEPFRKPAWISTEAREAKHMIHPSWNRSQNSSDSSPSATISTSLYITPLALLHSSAAFFAYASTSSPASSNSDPTHTLALPDELIKTKAFSGHKSSESKFSTSSQLMMRCNHGVCEAVCVCARGGGGGEFVRNLVRRGEQ